MKKALNRLILPVFVIFILGCNSGLIYENSRSFTKSWNRYDTVVFKAEIYDTVNTYEFYLDVRNSNEYKYSNIYFFLHTVFPEGEIAHDTIECVLADKSGRWLGKGISSIKENNILLRDRLIFPQAGKYIFKIEQAMRTENLEGIEDIGIRIQKISD